MRLRVCHRHRRLIGQGLQELEILGSVRGLRSLGAEHEEPARLRLEAERHEDLRAQGGVGAEGAFLQRGEARIGSELIA